VALLQFIMAAFKTARVRLPASLVAHLCMLHVLTDVRSSCAQTVVCCTISSTERCRRRRDAALECIRAPDAARDFRVSTGPMELDVSVLPLWPPRWSMMPESLCQRCWWPRMVTGAGQARVAIDSSAKADGRMVVARVRTSCGSFC
jgi:hypothetical protein